MYPWTVYPPSSSSEEASVQVNDTGGKLLVVVGIHGDEPCGWTAVQEFYSEFREKLTKPVTFLFANPFAAQQKKRYIETDLNRNFGQKYDADESSMEMSLAGHIQSIVSNFDVVISLHATQSTDEPFALFGPPLHKSSVNILRRVGISKAVLIEKKYQRGSMVVYPGVIEFECGYQNTIQAKENAKRIIKGSIASIDGLQNESSISHNDVRVFTLRDSIPKPNESVTIHVDNLTTVSERELVAESDSTKFFAPSRFTPILMSAEGYQDILGYHGEELGWLSEATIEIHQNKPDYITRFNFTK